MYPSYDELIKQDRIELNQALRIMISAPLDEGEPLTPGAVDRLHAAREWAWRQHDEGVFTITPRRVRGRRYWVNPKAFFLAAVKRVPDLRGRLGIPIQSCLKSSADASANSNSATLPKGQEACHQTIRELTKIIRDLRKERLRDLREITELRPQAEARKREKDQRSASARRQAQKRKNEESL